MHTKRSLSYAIVALTLPLSLCLPHTLVAAFRIYDYIPSSLGSLRSSGGRSMLVRRADVPESGYYNPSDYGGYMMTVSFCFLPLLCSSTLSGGLLFPDITTRLRVCRGLIAEALITWFMLVYSGGSHVCAFRARGLDSTLIQSGRSDLESP